MNGIRGERVPSAEKFPDPKDIVFYEVAMSKEDAYLVTGNKKHFPDTPIVVTPAEMVEILKEHGRLLIISTSTAIRQSRATALARNRYICELADYIMMVGVTEDSSLYGLQEEFRNKLLP